MWHRSRKFSVILLNLFLLVGCGGAATGGNTGGTPTPTPTTSQLQRATDGINTLQGWYNQSTGIYNTTGWWNSANAITVLVDYARLTNSTQYNSVLQNTFTVAPTSQGFPGFINQYYDDEGWWALAWIDAYDLTKNSQYLTMAGSIFSDMAGGWDNTCGGGIWWNKDRKYKNAIANELFLSVAAHLANRVTDPTQQSQYLDWANKEWTWFAASGMINSQNLINDGLNITTSTSGTSCTNNGQQTWSYNQGVVLGGLTELSKLNTDPSLSQKAQEIATAAITRLVDASGVMHDPCEANCGADGVQFKGIFVRNLVALHTAYPQASYKTFIDANANSIWDKSQGTNYQFGQVWSGPFDAGNAGSQSSALDAIVGAASVDAAK